MHRYADDMRERFALERQQPCGRTGQHDGYLLQWFVEAGVPALGIEPAANVAAAAEAKGVPTLVKFFGHELARSSPPTAGWRTCSSATTCSHRCPT